MINFTTVARFAVLFTLATCMAASASQYQPSAISHGYGQSNWEFSPEMNLGDITFVDHYPAVSSLSDAERFMVAGGRKDGRKVYPWHKMIFMVAGAYYNKFGQLPEQLTPEAYRSIADLDPSVTNDEIALLPSPLTGNYPRLNQASFSPGDFYMKVLSEDEMRHLAQFRPHLQALWFEHRNANDRAVSLIHPPIYYRMYGDDGVITNVVATACREL